MAPPDLVFQSWPDTPAFEILNGEPALTFVPYLAVTGAVAIVASLALAPCVGGYAQHARGPAVLLILSVALLLMGGGIFLPLIGILLALAAALIGVAGREPGRLARRVALAWRIALAVGVVGYLALFPGMVLASGLFGVASDGLVLLFAVLAFGGLITALGTARAHDRIAAHRSGHEAWHCCPIREKRRSLITGGGLDFLADLRHELDWNLDAKQVEKLTDGPVAVGTRFRAQWARTQPTDVEVIRYDVR